MKIGLWSSATRQPPALYDVETRKEIATVKTDEIGRMIMEAVNGGEEKDKQIAELGRRVQMLEENR